MRGIAELIADDQVDAPDIICGGTPCQAFSFAGWQKGLNDDRGNLTLEFVDIVNSNDSARERAKKDPCLVFWENVVGVLSDKTNAFGCFISSLAGLKSALPLPEKRWPSAGLLGSEVPCALWHGVFWTRNISEYRNKENVFTLWLGLCQRQSNRSFLRRA